MCTSSMQQDCRNCFNCHEWPILMAQACKGPCCHSLHHARKIRKRSAAQRASLYSQRPLYCDVQLSANSVLTLQAKSLMVGAQPFSSSSYGYIYMGFEDGCAALTGWHPITRTAMPPMAITAEYLCMRMFACKSRSSSDVMKIILIYLE